MEGLKRDWGLELVHDQSVPGSIPATSATFSREPGMLKFVWCWHTHNRMGDKNNQISAALTGLNKYSLRTNRVCAKSQLELYFVHSLVLKV